MSIDGEAVTDSGSLYTTAGRPACCIFISVCVPAHRPHPHRVNHAMISVDLLT